MILQKKNKFEFQFLNRFKKILKLSAVRKVPETITFQALGIIETLGSIISHGTSKKFADVRPHLRKVLKYNFIFNLRIRIDCPDPLLFIRKLDNIFDLINGLNQVKACLINRKIIDFICQRFCKRTIRE